MSKAILVLPEMPENCEECFLKNAAYNVCDVAGRDVPHSDEPRYIRCKATRPDWCPLREMPERMKTGGVYKGGWNDCLRAIEGSGEDD